MDLCSAIASEALVGLWLWQIWNLAIFLKSG